MEKLNKTNYIFFFVIFSTKWLHLAQSKHLRGWSQWFDSFLGWMNANRKSHKENSVPSLSANCIFVVKLGESKRRIPISFVNFFFFSRAYILSNAESRKSCKYTSHICCFINGKIPYARRTKLVDIHCEREILSEGVFVYTLHNLQLLLQFGEMLWI